MRQIQLFCVSLFLASTLFAQTSVQIHNSRLHELPSVHAQQIFEISIALPGSYFTKDTTYPVIYMTDANVHFGMMTDIARSLQGGKEMPEAIIVGIGYPAKQRKLVGALRLRDLTPTHNEQMDKRMGKDSLKSGGGPAFLHFIKEELIPFVEQNYRVKSDHRTFTGYSIAGLFGLYMAFQEPQLFQQYIIGSPSIWYDSKFIVTEEQKHWARQQALDAKIFMSVGALENSMVQDMVDLAGVLKGRAYKNLLLHHAVLDGETHASAVSGCFQQGLRFLFRTVK